MKASAETMQQWASRMADEASAIWNRALSEARADRKAKEISDYLTLGWHHSTDEAQKEISKIILDK